MKNAFFWDVAPCTDVSEELRFTQEVDGTTFQKTAFINDNFVGINYSRTTGHINVYFADGHP
jgi:prepilin-type processing-associated H-X9-DG protein